MAAPTTTGSTSTATGYRCNTPKAAPGSSSSTEWKPNILTDHHEMGKDATFFFMPGEPTRVHPMTPEDQPGTDRQDR